MANLHDQPTTELNDTARLVMLSRAVANALDEFQNVSRYTDDQEFCGIFDVLYNNYRQYGKQD